jgi:hypothetical protein
MDAGGCDDSPVSRIPESATHSGDLSGNFDVDRDNVESGSRPEGGEEFLGRDPQPCTALAEQHRDFEQRDGTQRQRLASTRLGAPRPLGTPDRLVGLYLAVTRPNRGWDSRP